MRLLVLDAYSREGRAALRGAGGSEAGTLYRALLLRLAPAAAVDVAHPADGALELPDATDLDRYAGVAALVERYRKLRDEWLIARRDLVDRTNRAREMAQEADRLKFALTEISGVDPRPGEDVSLVAEIRRLSELDSVREAASGARTALSGAEEEYKPRVKAGGKKGRA